jgi:hypothetical protein
MDPLDAWIACPDGCGYSHRHGDPFPLHRPAWLEEERQRLTAELAAMTTDRDECRNALAVLEVK